MLKKITVHLVAILIMACSGGGGGGDVKGDPLDSVVIMNGMRAYGVCRHEALIAAVIYEEAGYETRILYGPMIKYGSSYHVQAQAKINGRWQWLEVGRIDVFIGDQDDFEITKEYTADDLFDFSMGGVWY